MCADVRGGPEWGWAWVKVDGTELADSGYIESLSPISPLLVPYAAPYSLQAATRMAAGFLRLSPVSPAKW